MKKILLTLLTALLFTAAGANNITVTAATLSGQNVATHTEIVNFTVGWENSWHTSINESNYDGAWIFVKFRRLTGTADWRHCTLTLANSVVGTGTGGIMTVQNDLKGAFINRNADGIGNVSFIGNQLVWNYGADGVADNETVEINVFGLEMVYIPTGAFQLGSGGSENNAFQTGPTAAAGSNSVPYNVTAATISFGNTGTNLNTNGKGPTAGSLSAVYPTGYKAFWIMKYETTQQQYVDFLNHLDLARATTNNTPGIFTGVHPNLIAPQPERTVSTINSQRLASLADWSGLRPYTEMEFEKICRGANIPPLPNEYVWGSTTISPLATVLNTGLTNETVNTPATANTNIGSSYNNNSLTRAGIFARATGSARELSGSSYYGVMNMADNAIEICINIVSATGLAFDGSINGDGNLNANGDTDITNWTNSSSYGWRGSSFINTVSYARTSDRSQASVNDAGSLYNYIGIRLARTAQ
jgi:formylglycine-generating enzyme required for sulfatase activity